MSADLQTAYNTASDGQCEKLKLSWYEIQDTVLVCGDLHC